MCYKIFSSLIWGQIIVREEISNAIKIVRTLLLISGEAHSIISEVDIVF